MSTSDHSLAPGAVPETGNWAAGLHAIEGVPPGIPAPSELARMANELFNALPQSLQQPAASVAAAALPPNSAFNGNPYAVVPSPTAPAMPGLLAGLSEAQPGAFVAAPDRGAVPAVGPSASTPAGGISVPSGGVDPSAGLPFAFLSNARPLFVEPAAESAPANTPSHAFGGSAPSDEGFAAIPFSLLTQVQSASPSQFAQSPQPPAPAIPGALGAVDSSAIPAFSFLEDARPLFQHRQRFPAQCRPGQRSRLPLPLKTLWATAIPLHLRLT